MVRQVFHFDEHAGQILRRVSMGQTVCTDFPDASLVANLERNADTNIPSEKRSRIAIEVRRSLSNIHIADAYAWYF